MSKKRQARRAWKASLPLAKTIHNLYMLRNIEIDAGNKKAAAEWQEILGIAFDIQKNRPTDENIKAIAKSFIRKEDLLKTLKEDCEKAFPNEVERINLLLTFS